jgi:hypothetical protein
VALSLENQYAAAEINPHFMQEELHLDHQTEPFIETQIIIKFPSIIGPYLSKFLAPVPDNPHLFYILISKMGNIYFAVYSTEPNSIFWETLIFQHENFMDDFCCSKTLEN